MIGNLDLYRIFHVAGRSKSISKAAQELYMTQSAVSQAIKKLENELEIQLFLRTPKGVVLTDEGQLLHEHISSALGMIHAGEGKLLEFKTLRKGNLRIGVGDTISRYYLLPFLNEFRFKYPGIKINILNGTTSEICEFIKSGKVDVGVCNLPIQNDQIEAIPCKEIQDIFVCGDKYKRMTTERVSLEYLMKMPLIFLERKSNSRVYVENFLKNKGFELSPMFELGSYDLVIEFTKMNFGISCVIKEFSKDYLDRGELHEVILEEGIPTRSIGICHLKNVSLSHAAMKFVESII